jgi:hypothetical protein
VKGTYDQSAIQYHDSSTNSRKFIDIGGCEKNGSSIRCRIDYFVVQADPCGNVHPLARAVKQEHYRSSAEPFAEKNFLLIAATECSQLLLSGEGGPDV